MFCIKNKFLTDIILIENHRIFVTIILFLSYNYTRGEVSEEKPLYTKHALEGVDQSVTPT